MVHRISLAQNWRRRGKFEEVKFIFPNAPTIPITVVSTLDLPNISIDADMSCRMEAILCRAGMIL